MQLNEDSASSAAGDRNRFFVVQRPQEPVVNRSEDGSKSDREHSIFYRPLVRNQSQAGLQNNPHDDLNFDSMDILENEL